MITERRTFLKRISFLTAGFVLLALGADDCTAPGGVDTPIGPVYWGGAEKTPENVRHEECHDRRRQQLGDYEYYKRYLTEPNFACNEELRCGATLDHIACKNRR